MYGHVLGGNLSSLEHCQWIPCNHDISQHDSSVAYICCLVGTLAIPVVKRTFQRLLTDAVRYRQAAIADSTRRQYALHGHYWERFCLLFQVPSTPTQQSAILFITFLALSQTFSTVRSTMTGVKHYWAQRGWEFDILRWSEYNAVLKGIRREKKGVPQRKHPVSPDELQRMASLFSAEPFARAMWACIVITWWAMFRKSNTTVNERAPDGVGHCIRKQDVLVDFEQWRLHITVRGSKTNQYQDRVFHAHLQGRRGHPLDPVAAWLGHVEASPDVEPTMSAFSFREKGITQPMRYEYLRVALKVCYSAIGGDAAHVSTHSLRRGGATFAYHAGVQDLLLKAHGDWVSNCFEDYIELSKPARLLCSQQMFELMESGRAARMYPAVAPRDHLVPLPHQLPQQAEPTGSGTTVTDPAVLQWAETVVQQRLVATTHNKQPRAGMYTDTSTANHIE
jgi:integrase